MHTKVINNIQTQLFELTKKKYSKKYINTNIFPIIEYIVYSNKTKFLISGSQGIGKSTLIKILKTSIEKYFDKKIIALSLDDYYLSKNDRLKLSKKIHPLFKTRGVPGTHDIKKLKKNLDDFQKSNYPIYTPIFDKLIDDRSNKIRKEIIKKDILILEGWCCACPPLDKKFLKKNINDLEKSKDKDRIWRNYINKNLIYEYKKIFKIFDKIIFLKAPSFDFVLSWRLKQERMNNSKSINNKKMNKKEILQFILHYEKLTRWMIRELPKFSNLVIHIDKNQKIIKRVIN